MIRREGKGPPSTSDLLVCFPRRAHLTLMPKPACSPRQNLQRHYQNHLKKSMRSGRNLSIGGGHASPYTLSGTKQMGSDNLSEPTSPKVTCAGQIKVRPSTKSCKNWQSVMEEIERLHINNNKKKSTWVETLGFKKEVMHFLSCLRKLKFDFHCVGAFSHVDISSDDEEDGDTNDIEINQDQDQVNNHHVDDHDNHDEEEVSSRTVFSKWLVVLQENEECDVHEKDQEKSLKSSKEAEELPSCPPPNALLLMRCRSAPAKSWMEEKAEEDEKLEKDHDHDHDHEHDKEKEQEEELTNKEIDQLEKKESKRKSLMELMQIESGDFYKLSCDIAKETWVIGGIHKDPFSRSRSWKR
uniref:uncharacterized protein LOC122588784 n=1 Tax=Erigeron canadensis TaxID=72917 RepID=UPI001CB98677|nr:uncharacterized protein LOC122588784 [Erigeron canadensis]